MAERIRGRKGVALRRRRLRRSKGLCERCLPKDIVRLATVVNHVLPLAHGGEDVDENTENLCRECDLEVTAEQFGFKKRIAVGDDGWPVT